MPASVFEAMDARQILLKYYDEDTPLFRTLWTHSVCVAEKALRCIEGKDLDIDREFVKEAALLHDIGVFRCHAPSIFCVGELPYIAHGVEGRKILEAEGLPRHALVCERHTGSGLTVGDISRQHLPLPLRDMTPQTLEEKLVCYADKFFSKSGEIDREKPLEVVQAQMARFGDDSLRRFTLLHSLFG